MKQKAYSTKVYRGFVCIKQTYFKIYFFYRVLAEAIILHAFPISVENECYVKTDKVMFYI